MPKTKIDINEVLNLEKRKNEINALELDDIIWMDGDKEVEVLEGSRKYFKFIGLSNINFISMGLYNDKEFAGELVELFGKNDGLS